MKGKETLLSGIFLPRGKKASEDIPNHGVAQFSELSLNPVGNLIIEKRLIQPSGNSQCTRNRCEQGLEPFLPHLRRVRVTQCLHLLHDRGGQVRFQCRRLQGDDPIEDLIQCRRIDIPWPNQRHVARSCLGHAKIEDRAKRVSWCNNSRIR